MNFCLPLQHDQCSCTLDIFSPPPILMTKNLRLSIVYFPDSTNAFSVIYLVQIRTMPDWMCLRDSFSGRMTSFLTDSVSNPLRISTHVVLNTRVKDLGKQVKALTDKGADTSIVKSQLQAVKRIFRFKPKGALVWIMNGSKDRKSVLRNFKARI